MRRAGRWQAHIADRKDVDGRQNILPVRRLRLGSVEEHRTDPAVRAKEALEVVYSDGSGVDFCVQAADARTGLQHIPECDAGCFQFVQPSLI